MHAELAIELVRAGDGSVVARGALAVAPFWCRWDGATLWFVGSAATPVGEDDITVDLRVGPGVHAAVRSVAAMVVYAARGAGTSMTTRLHVAPGASLDWRPEPVIVTARARHRSLLLADVASGGALVADELVVLGRSDEVAGAFTATTDLRIDGQPVSLTSFDTALPGWSGPGGTDAAKVVGTRVLVGAGPEGGRAEAGAVALCPEGGGALATALAPDPDQVRASLDRILPRSVRTPVPLSTATVPVPVRAPVPIGGG
ncbi:MAG: urease accessory protein ureD 3 [Ilumatobacteraceae bacterium]|nr:urease accessory protein ureD 3 [Ilumatobacteraceae bacterium]